MLRTTVVVTFSLLTLLAAGCTKSEASGRNGTALSLTKPSGQTLTQGGSNRVNIAVDRTGFADAVTVAFSNLPSGVRVEGDSIPAGSSSKDFVLIAAPDAAIVNNQIVTVQAKGAGINTSQTFELTVKSKS
jgi:hypothetical protein